MSQSKLNILASIFIAIMLSACGGGGNRSVNASLKLAEDIMDEKPDSALSIIQAIDSALISGERHNAMYSTLLALARYKNNFNDTVAGPVASAADYFLSDGDNRHAAVAMFLCGFANFNSADYSSALINYLEAEKQAEIINDPFWMATAQRAQGQTYKKLWNTRSEVDVYKKAYSNFLKTGRNNFIRHGLYDLAIALKDNKDYDESIAICKKGFKIAENENDTVLMAHFTGLAARNSFYKFDYSEAKKGYLKVIEYGQDFMSDGMISELGNCFIETGEIQKAIECQDFLSTKNSDEHWLEAMIALHFKDYYEYSRIMAEENKIANDAVIQVEKMASTKAVAQHFLMQQQLEEQKNKTTKNMITLCSIFILLLICIIVFFTRKHITALNTRIAQNMEEVVALKQHLEEKDTLFSESNGLLSEQAHKIASSTLNFIKEFSSKYYDPSETDQKKKTVFHDKIMENLKLLGSDRDYNDNLEIISNKNRNNIVADLRRDVQDLNENEIQLFVFRIFNLTSKSIAFLQGVRIDAVYNRKSSLKRKITYSNSPRKQEFLDFIA